MPSSKLVAFVRAVGREGGASRSGDMFITRNGAKAPADQIAELVSRGVLSGTRDKCQANSSTPGWIRRQMLESDHHAGQHREIVDVKGVAINLCESPIARLALAAGAGGKPFLALRHVEAAERVRRLFERSALRGKLTTRYDEIRASSAGRGRPSDLSDMAVDARRALATLYDLLPHECAEAVIDICGFLKGLQQVEAERAWPKRSAKLILRMGLDRLADHYGFAGEAIGAPTQRVHQWLADGARPTRFE